MQSGFVLLQLFVATDLHKSIFICLGFFIFQFIERIRTQVTFLAAAAKSVFSLLGFLKTLFSSFREVAG